MKKNVTIESDTADRIIEAAIPLFATKGFDGVSVRELIEAANISNVGAISYYFGGKTGLYTTILKRQFEINLALASSIQNTQHTPVQKLQQVITTIAGVYRQSPHTLRLVFNEISKPACGFETIREPIEKLISVFRSIVREGITQGYFRPDADPGCVALAIHGMIQLAFLNPNFSARLLPDSENKYEYFVSHISNYLLQGLLTAKK